MQTYISVLAPILSQPSRRTVSRRFRRFQRFLWILCYQLCVRLDIQYSSHVPCVEAADEQEDQDLCHWYLGRWCHVSKLVDDIRLFGSN